MRTRSSGAPPTEGADRLKEEVIMEAYLRARERLGLRGKLTWGARELKGPLRVERWEMTDQQREAAGPRLWEPTVRGPWANERRCAFSRALAAAGVAT